MVGTGVDVWRLLTARVDVEDGFLGICGGEGGRVAIG